MGIIGGLLLGWFLGLFGFKGVVIAGMAQLFGLKLTVLGYYFMFAILGFFIFLVNLFKRPKSARPTKDEIKEATEELKKAIRKL